MADNAYSRLVGLLKVLLPLAALALLSMLFMLSRAIDPDTALPYAQVDIDQMLRDPRVTAPTYSGVTQDGDELLFAAETAHPGGADGTGARALGPRVRLIGPDGTETRARADEARINPTDQLLELTGTVQLETARGWRVETDGLLTRLDRSQMDSPGKVIAESPQGRLEAGSFTLTRGTAPGQELLVFNGGVKLLYQPDAASPAP